jgi:hypothetical protein
MFERFFLAIIVTLSLYLFLQTNQSSPSADIVGERNLTPSSFIISKLVHHNVDVRAN